MVGGEAVVGAVGSQGRGESGHRRDGLRVLLLPGGQHQAVELAGRIGYLPPLHARREGLLGGGRDAPDQHHGGDQPTGAHGAVEDEQDADAHRAEHGEHADGAADRLHEGVGQREIAVGLGLLGDHLGQAAAPEYRAADPAQRAQAAYRNGEDFLLDARQATDLVGTGLDETRQRPGQRGEEQQPDNRDEDDPAAEQRDDQQHDDDERVVDQRGAATAADELAHAFHRTDAHQVVLDAEARRQVERQAERLAHDGAADARAGPGAEPGKHPGAGDAQAPGRNGGEKGANAQRLEGADGTARDHEVVDDHRE